MFWTQKPIPVWVLEWILRPPAEEKPLLHTKQICERSRWCTDALCVLRIFARLNAFPHSLHWYGFSPVCKNKCAFSWAFMTNRLSHIWHTLLRSCWCFIFLCLDKIFGYAYDTPHSSHTYGLSPVMKRIVNWISYVTKNMKHFNRFYLPVWVRVCALSSWAVI